MPTVWVERLGRLKSFSRAPIFHFHAFISLEVRVYQWIFVWEKQGDVFIYSTFFLDLENLRVWKYVASWQVVYNQMFIESAVPYRIMGSQNWWGDTRGLLLYRYKIKWITFPYIYIYDMYQTWASNWTGRIFGLRKQAHNKISPKYYPLNICYPNIIITVYGRICFQKTNIHLRSKDSKA